MIAHIPLLRTEDDGKVLLLVASYQTEGIDQQVAESKLWVFQIRRGLRIHSCCTKKACFSGKPENKNNPIS
jgi:hypothetical protein